MMRALTDPMPEADMSREFLEWQVLAALARWLGAVLTARMAPPAALPREENRFEERSWESVTVVTASGVLRWERRQDLVRFGAADRAGGERLGGRCGRCDGMVG